MGAGGREGLSFGEGGRPCEAARPPSTSARAAARTRAHSLRPPARGGSAGGRKAAVTYFLRLRSGQSGRLDRHSVPSQPRAPQGGRTPGTREGSWGCAGGTLCPGASPRGPPPPPLGRPPRVPQLVPVRPMNWCVLGFHTNSFHSSTTCPQLFFSFWMTISAEGDESRTGLRATAKLRFRALEPSPRTGTRREQRQPGRKSPPSDMPLLQIPGCTATRCGLPAARRGMHRS